MIDRRLRLALQFFTTIAATPLVTLPYHNLSLCWRAAHLRAPSCWFVWNAKRLPPVLFLFEIIAGDVLSQAVVLCCFRGAGIAKIGVAHEGDDVVCERELNLPLWRAAFGFDPAISHGPQTVGRLQGAPRFRLGMECRRNCSGHP